MNPSAQPQPALIAPAQPHWPLQWSTLPALVREALARERTLALFALLLWAAMVPALFALGLDERTLRGVSVWAKPLKFMASIGLFSISAAWFIGLLPPARRAARPVRWLMRTIVGCATFEIVYITIQAALGEGSHYNIGDALHATLYPLMGLAALAMTATQPWLAWEISRHGDTNAPAPWRRAVTLGLTLTFVLGASSGMLLAQAQPPDGFGLPLFGWHFGADLRPAHFLGMHAQQLLPLAGLALAWLLPGPASRRALTGFALAYIALWVALMVLGLHGTRFTLPP
jgi:hypothetical protein